MLLRKWKMHQIYFVQARQSKYRRKEKTIDTKKMF